MKQTIICYNKEKPDDPPICMAYLEDDVIKKFAADSSRVDMETAHCNIFSGKVNMAIIDERADVRPEIIYDSLLFIWRNMMSLDPKELHTSGFVQIDPQLSPM